MTKRNADVVVRPKRQVTLPSELCDQLGIVPGDVLEFTVEGSALVARPRKVAALTSLREIQRAFKASGVSEDDVQQSAKRVRQEVARERYGARS
jgi:AbrB family looped-hinge helix DNA binding protein